MLHHTHNNSFRFSSAALLCAALAGGSVAPGTSALAQCFEWEDLPSSFDPDSLIPPWVMIHFNGETYGGGWALFRLDGEEWVWTGAPVLVHVRAVAVQGGELLVGGSNAVATTVGGDDSQWELIGPMDGGTVYAIGEFQGDLIVGGNFTEIGGVAANNIARWDGTQWHPLADGLNGWVLALAEYDGKLVVGGAFSGPGNGGVELRRIAQWDGSSYSPVGTGMIGERVSALIAYNGTLIAGGVFTHAGNDSGDVPAENIARFNGTAWGAMDGGVSVSGTSFDHGVWDFAPFGTDLIIGGNFISVNGDPSMQRVARWSDDPAPGAFGWYSMGQVGNPGSIVRAVAADDHSVTIGGAFGQINGTPMLLAARWHAGLPVFTDHPQHAQIVKGGEAMFTAAVSDPDNVFYQWLRDGVPLADYNNGNASGYHTPILTLINVSEDDLGAYTLEVSNQCGQRTSKAALLSVVPEPSEPGCLADLNSDGAVGVGDLLILLGGWGACP